MVEELEKKRGYKKTKLGWIPEEWEVLRYDEILATSYLGGSYQNSGIKTNRPLIKMGNLLREKISLEKIEYIAENEPVAKEHMLQNGDLLLNTRNSWDLVGKVAIWRSELPIAYFNSNILKMSFLTAKITSNHFMNYAFNSCYGLKQMKAIAIGSTSVAAVYERDINTIKFIIPTLFEQQKIVEILSTWDDGIEILGKLIEQKELQHRALTQKLFKEKDNWQTKRFDSIFQDFCQKNCPNETLLSATQNNGVIPRSMLSGNVMSPEGSLTGYKLIHKGDFVISLRSFQGGIEYSNYQGILSPAYTILKNKIDIDTDFYKYFFKSYKFIEKYLSIAVIGIRDGKQISYNDLCSIKIPYPPIDEQNKIAKLLNTSTEEIKILNSKLAKLKEQKKGLMQKLLTGQIRVKV